MKSKKQVTKKYNIALSMLFLIFVSIFVSVGIILQSSYQLLQTQCVSETIIKYRCYVNTEFWHINIPCWDIK